MKYIIYILFPLLILLSIIILNIINRYFSLDINIRKNAPKTNINNYRIKKRFLSDVINQKNITKDIKLLNESFLNQKKKTKKFFKSLNKSFKEHIFEGEVNYTNYTNYTNNNETIYKNGIMKMRIILPYDKNVLNDNKYPIYKVKILENKTLDNWFLISIVNNITRYDTFEKNLSLYSYNKTFISLSYNSRIDQSHYFSLPYLKKFCNIQYDINLIYNNSIKNISENNTDEIIGIKGDIYSDECKIKMEFNLDKHSIAVNKLNNNIKIYCLFFSFLSLFHLINTKILIQKIDLSMVNCNSISIFTICQNIIWNCYCCYNHFFLLLNFMEYKLYFLLICSLNFINFGFIEFPLLYQLLSLKYSHLINDVLSYRKKMIQFCFIFYITILFSFIYVMKCYYSPPFILFSFIFAWLPQIIFNIRNKNRVSFPIIYIIGVVLNRIFPSFYFNFFENNFLRIPLNKKIVFISISILLLLTLILYTQTLLGPRWFLPILQVEEYNFYIDEKELKKIKKDIDGLECLICLNPIIEKNNQNLDNYDNGIGFNETDNLVIEVNDNNLDYNNDNKNKWNKICRFKYKNRCCGNNSIILNFHEFSKNIMNKPFMITPCKHVFHSDCLEEWFKMKKECPNCRTLITQDMYN